MYDSVDHLAAALKLAGYATDREAVTVAYLAVRLNKPLLIEGHAGTGKSELGRAIARALNARLVRLQCFPGIDESAAFYEWDRERQRLHLRLGESDLGNRGDLEREAYSPDFLLRRPLLEAFLPSGAASTVLLVDELDAAGVPFEATLFDILESGMLNIPDFGLVRPEKPPFVVVTSNRTRELTSLTRRRSLYLWLEYPAFERECEIVLRRAPGAGRPLVGQVCNFVEKLREQPFARRPGVTETIDWARALVLLHTSVLDPAIIDQTIGCLLKEPGDIEAFRHAKLARLVQPMLDRAG